MKKLLLGLVLCLALIAVAPAAVITDPYSIPQTKVTATGTTPTPAASLVGIPGATRSLTVVWANNTDGNPGSEVSASVFNELAFSQDTKTTGSLMVEYILSADLTAWPSYTFNLDVTYADVVGGALEFFVRTTGGGYQGVGSLPLLSTSPPTTTLIKSFLSSNIVDAANVTGVGFYVTGTPASKDMNFDNFSLTQVPEPGTYALIGAGLAALAALRRRK